MALNESDRQVLREYLARQPSRRGVGYFLAAFGIAMMIFATWMVLMDLDAARSQDTLLETASDIDPKLISELRIHTFAANFSLSIALSVANGLVGLFIFLGGVVVLVGTPAGRAFQALVRSAETE